MAKINELFNVEGLCVVVTGGASGIGFGYTEVMSANKARVAIFDRDTEAMDGALKKLRDSGADAIGLSVDVTDKSALNSAMAEVVEQFGRLDVVFANAGISGGPGFVTTDGHRPEDRMIENTDPDLLDRVLEVNIGATFKTIQAAIPHLKAGGGGRIIVTSSISATHTELLVGGVYVVSKGGVGMLVKQAARELATYNILVNAISPGPVVTNIGGGRLQDAAARAPFDKAAPIGRIATPQDLQGAALFLSSPASSYITGAEILIDGGTSLGSDTPTR